MMKKWWILLLPLIIAFVVVSVFSAPAQKENAAPAQKEKAEKTQGVEEQGKTMTISGELIDLVCYATSAGKSMGDAHATCAAKCAKSGLPVGIVDKEKNIYVIVTKDHKPTNLNEDLMAHMAKQVSVTGKVFRLKGLNVIEMESVKPLM